MILTSLCGLDGMDDLLAHLSGGDPGLDGVPVHGVRGEVVVGEGEGRLGSLYRLVTWDTGESRVPLSFTLDNIVTDHTLRLRDGQQNDLLLYRHVHRGCIGF